LPIPDLHRQQILFVHKFIHRKRNCLPNVFADYFVLNRNVHSYITRDNNDLHVAVVNKNYGKKVSNIKQPSFGMDYLIH